MLAAVPLHMFESAAPVKDTRNLFTGFPSFGLRRNGTVCFDGEQLVKNLAALLKDIGQMDTVYGSQITGLSASGWKEDRFVQHEQKRVVGCACSQNFQNRTFYTLFYKHPLEKASLSSSFVLSFIHEKSERLSHIIIAISHRLRTTFVF